MAAGEKNLLDIDQVKGLKEAFSSDFKNFITVYFQDFETKEKELFVAIKEKKLEEINKLAHALKGSSLNVGAMGLAKACEQIEIASKQGSYDNAMETYGQLQKICSKSKEEYMKFTS